MPDTADAVIIGGGVMGCSILYNLASQGLTNTLLLEQGVLSSGSTGRSQAILRMHYSNEVTTRMAWESLRVFKAFDELTGRPAGYVRTGYLLIVGESDRHAMQENVAMQRQAGVSTQVISAEDVREIAPAIAVQEGEALAYEPESGSVDPYAVTTGYANRACQMGARVQTGVAATEIEVSGGRVSAVATPQGKVETPTAVVAAGPWSGPLLQKLGVELPLHPLRHQVITYRRPEYDIPAHPIIGDVVHSISARPEGALTLAGVGEEEHVGPDQLNHGVDMPMVEATLAGLTARMPAMSSAIFRGGWSGLFTTTPDWHPIMDRVEGIEGLYCAVGFSGHGFKLSPMVGLTMAELITQGRAATIDTSMLTLARFRQGRHLKSRYRMNVLA